MYSKDIPWIIKSYLRIARIFEDTDQWEKARMIYNKIIGYETSETIFAQERLDWINENIKK